MSAIPANVVKSDVVDTMEGDTAEHRDPITELGDDEDPQPVTPSSDHKDLSWIPTPAIDKLLEEAAAENRRAKEQRLEELQAQTRQLRSATRALTDAVPPIGTPVGMPGYVPAAGSVPAAAPLPGLPIKAKTLCPNKMHPYKGSSKGEHLRWFRKVKVKFLMSPEYFTTETAKVVYCMQSLKSNASTQWHSYFDTHDMNYVTFAFFEKFLLCLVADPINRRLDAYERWEAAKQQPDQKVSVFKVYLEELEAHLPPLDEDVRAKFFLAKLKPELKEKILATGNVPKQREEILAQAIMQEKNLERTHANH